MSKLSRITQRIFGSGAGINQIAQFGSLFAGTPAFTTSAATAQSLSNWLTGWFAAAIGGNAPAIEDMNAAFFVATYQLAYLMQSGVPEWDTSTIYFIGSFASDGAGKIYYSLTDNNTGNALSDITNWAEFAPRTAYLVGVASITTAAPVSRTVSPSVMGPFADNASVPAPVIELAGEGGTIQTTDANNFKFSVTGMKKGTYRATFAFAAQVNPSKWGQITISDGVSLGGFWQSFNQGSNSDYRAVFIQGEFTYAADGDHTYELWGQTDDTAIALSPVSSSSKCMFTLERVS